MSTEYLKTKSAAKIMIPRGEKLVGLIKKTLREIATIVGGTLGPAGRPVLIERPEFGLPPSITKDGVTVFRGIGYKSAVQHCIMESARDSSTRTADEAGDGTTTATILAEAFTSRLLDYCDKNKHESPQAVVRQIQGVLQNTYLPALKKLSKKANLDSPSGRRLLRNVAQVSGNGDGELADAVMEAFAYCGDDGNVTIHDASGPYGYTTEPVKGYPIAMGFEESCQRYAPDFVNRPETLQAVLDNPMFLLYHGRVSDVSTIMPILRKIADGLNGGPGGVPYLKTPNLVIAATGFSDSVLAYLLLNWKNSGGINILPLKVPHSPQTNGEMQFLEDLAAVTAAEIYNQASKPVEDASFEGLGNLLPDEEGIWRPLGVTQVEMGRYRTTVIGHSDDDTLLKRAEELRIQLEQAESILDGSWTRERLAKISGGIAKITVYGSSNAELKERRDRVEDAVCAVRGAINHGVLVGGGWALAKLANLASDEISDSVMDEVVRPALLEPLRVLYQNAGMAPTEVAAAVMKMAAGAYHDAMKDAQVFDVATFSWTNGYKAGIFDSAPAVREALKNSISLATTMGTTGGLIVQPRNQDFEFQEARDAAEFDRVLQTDRLDGHEGT